MHMQYQEFLDLIYQKYSGNVKLELNRMIGLLADMGNPEKAFGGFHVGGTNGKGSVCATLEALCLAHGKSTAMNTSPHLIDYTERFRIQGREVDFQRVLDTFHRYEELFNKWDASFFEITTAIAFAMFAEDRIETGVIEVGLGGRLDATNLFVPDVAVITNIGLDHVKTLGPTKKIIAGEKAGIIKRGVPLVMGKTEPVPASVILNAAKAKDVPVYRYGRDWTARIVSDRVGGMCFDYHFEEFHFKALSANLIGEHQAINLGCAITAFILYARLKGFTVSEKAVRHALEHINWQGRMQLLSSVPVLIVDGAHNMHGITALISSLKKIYPRRKVRFLVSILADKNYPEMLRLICSRASEIYVAQNQSDRAASVEEQLGEINKYGTPAKGYSSVKEALEAALQDCGPNDVLVAGGSLYTVGEVISAFRKRQAHAPSH